MQRGILDEEAGRCIPRSRLGTVDPTDPASTVLGDGEAGELLFEDDVGVGRQSHPTANGPALGSFERRAGIHGRSGIGRGDTGIRPGLDPPGTSRGGAAGKQEQRKGQHRRKDGEANFCHLALLLPPRDQPWQSLSLSNLAQRQRSKAVLGFEEMAPETERVDGGPDQGLTNGWHSQRKAIRIVSLHSKAPPPPTGQDIQIVYARIAIRSAGD